MTSSAPIRLKIDMDNENRKGDAAFQWPEEKRKYWIVAMFCGTLLLYAARSAVPLCMAAMSSDMHWDKEIDVGLVYIQIYILKFIYLIAVRFDCRGAEARLIQTSCHSRV